MTDTEHVTQPENPQQDQRQLHVSILENGIVVFKFDRLSRSVFQEYLTYVRKYNGQYPDPLRVLYDLRGAGTPGLPFLELHAEAMDGLKLPERMRFAHLVDPLIAKHFYRTLMTRLPKIDCENQVFVREDEVIQWLMRPFDEDSSE